MPGRRVLISNFYGTGQDLCEGDVVAYENTQLYRVLELGPNSVSGRARVRVATLTPTYMPGLSVLLYAQYGLHLVAPAGTVVPPFAIPYWARRKVPYHLMPEGQPFADDKCRNCKHAWNHHFHVAANTTHCTTCRDDAADSSNPSAAALCPQFEYAATEWPQRGPTVFGDCGCDDCDLRAGWLDTEEKFRAFFQDTRPLDDRCVARSVTTPPEYQLHTCENCGKVALGSSSAAAVNYAWTVRKVWAAWVTGDASVYTHCSIHDMSWQLQNADVHDTYCICQICDTCEQPTASDQRCAAGHHLDCNCECMRCPSCDEVFHERVELSTCARCSNQRGCCCVCQSCAQCGADQTNDTNRCYNCRRCPKCCAANRDQLAAENRVSNCWRVLPDRLDTISRPVFQKGALTKWTPTSHWKGAVRDENPIGRLIGLEIECARGGTPRMTEVAVLKWDGNIVTDGSIGDADGFELNLAPAAGDKFLAQLKDITSEMARTGVSLNNNCGIHVHVDVSPFNIWDMRRLLLLYKKIEPAMFQVLAKRRTGNDFCIPCGEDWWKIINDPGRTSELKARLVNALYAAGSSRERRINPEDPPEMKRRKAKAFKSSQANKHHTLRYRALNVHSWFLRGTLEFRHAESMTKYESIRNWALTCAGIVEYAAQHSHAEIEKVPDGLEGLLKTAPTKTVRRWLAERYKSHRRSDVAEPEVIPPPARYEPVALDAMPTLSDAQERIYDVQQRYRALAQANRERVLAESSSDAYNGPEDVEF